jgi:YegS/Rv2252/BmrU family lipid kinase
VLCLLVNPSAGGGRALRRLPAIHAALAEHGLAVLRTATTRSLAHARELAGAAGAAGETVVAIGGDGLIGAVAWALADHPQARLGIIPGGRGNDLARVLGIPTEPRAACAVLAAGRSAPLDLGEVVWDGPDGAEQRSEFVGIASVGFDSEANRIANAAPSWLGGLVYAYGALRALVRWRPATFDLRLDGASPARYRGYSVAAANSRAYGGGMLLAPDALLDDGRLDIVVIEQMSRLRYLSRLPSVFRGTHTALPEINVLRAGEVEIAGDRPMTLYADGDPVAALPVRVRVRRHAVNVIVPASWPGVRTPAG